MVIIINKGYNYSDKIGRLKTTKENFNKLRVMARKH